MLTTYNDIFKSTAPKNAVRYTNTEELKKFIALNVFLGIVKLLNIKLYWSHSGSILYNAFPSSLMTSYRFTEFDVYFSFTTKKAPNDAYNNVTTQKIISFFNNRANEIYSPGESLSIDVRN